MCPLACPEELDGGTNTSCYVFGSKTFKKRNNGHYFKWRLRQDDKRMSLGRGIGLDEVVAMSLRGLVKIQLQGYGL